MRGLIVLVGSLMLGSVAWGDDHFVNPRLNRWASADESTHSSAVQAAAKLSEQAYQNAQRKNASEGTSSNSTDASAVAGSNLADGQATGNRTGVFALPPSIDLPDSSSPGAVKQAAYNQFDEGGVVDGEVIEGGEYIVDENDAAAGGYFENGHFITDQFMYGEGGNGGYCDGGYCDGGYCDGGGACAWGPGGCVEMDQCSRWWVRTDYLLWRITGFQVPVLISGSSPGTDVADAGVLGLPGTDVVYGGQTVNNDSLSGVRVSLGWHLDQERRKSIVLSYFNLGTITDEHRASGGILARPFYSVDPAGIGQNAELVSFPGVLEGSIGASVSTSMQGGSAEVMQVLSQCCNRRIGLSAGYAYYSLSDDVVISDTKQTLDNSLGLAIGTQIRERDQFATTNRYNGFTLGTNVMVCRNRWTLDLMMKMAMGQTRSKASLNGMTHVSVPTPTGVDTTTNPGGLLVLNSNTGSHELDQFAMIPQLGFDVGFYLTPRMSLHFGYDFIYWSRVARAGELIDTSVNLSQVAAGGLNGTAHPEFRWRFDDLAVHALDFGLTYRF